MGTFFSSMHNAVMVAAQGVSPGVAAVVAASAQMASLSLDKAPSEALAVQFKNMAGPELEGMFADRIQQSRLPHATSTSRGIV